MGIYGYENAFGAVDRTSRAMRRAIGDWARLYYGDGAEEGTDPSQRVAYTVVNKLCKSIFGEYQAAAEGDFLKGVVKALDERRKEAMQLAMVGGECYIKPCPQGAGFAFSLIPRENVLIFGRDSNGVPTDMGTVACSFHEGFHYTLLERRKMENGSLVIQYQLYRSRTPEALGQKVSLWAVPEYRALRPESRYDLDNLGLVRLKMPMLNCIDGSREPVAVFAAAAGLIRSIDRNEAQLSGEFDRGQSRIIVSGDMLRDGQLQDNVFVGLDEDPEMVGITAFAPALREQSYLARKQEYLRNVESIVGLKRGMLSDANTEDRTATEIATSAGDYNVTVIDLQGAWEQAVMETAALCLRLGQLYGMAAEPGRVSIDWGNGVLYDEDKTWNDYKEMVAAGLLKPEIALGWRFHMDAGSEEARAVIREKLMPEVEMDEQAQ